MRKDFLWPAATCIAVALAVSAAISLRGKHGESQSGGKLEELREALRQEAASPYRWCDLGEGLLEDGQKEKARYCFEQALKLAPNLPPIWMRAAFFHFQMEEPGAALHCSAWVLKIVPDYDQVIFNYYDRLVPSVAEVLPHLADNRRAGQAYFRHLLGMEAAGSAGTAWEWLRERRFADDGLAAEYLDLLLKQRMTEHAVEVWASYLGRRRGDYPDSNSLFNGQKRTVVVACFIPGVGKPGLRAHVPDGVRAHGGIRLPGLCANERTHHRRGNPLPHLRSGVERAVGRLYGAVEGDERLDTAGGEVPDSGGHAYDPGSGLPHAVLEVRQQDQGRGVGNVVHQGVQLAAVDIGHNSSSFEFTPSLPSSADRRGLKWPRMNRKQELWPRMNSD